MDRSSPARLRIRRRVHGLIVERELRVHRHVRIGVPAKNVTLPLKCGGRTSGSSLQRLRAAPPAMFKHVCAACHLSFACRSTPRATSRCSWRTSSFGNSFDRRCAPPRQHVVANQNCCRRCRCTSRVACRQARALGSGARFASTHFMSSCSPEKVKADDTNESGKVSQLSAPHTRDRKISGSEVARLRKRGVTLSARTGRRDASLGIRISVETGHDEGDVIPNSSVAEKREVAVDRVVDQLRSASRFSMARHAVDQQNSRRSCGGP